nr:hypothetical transcript [Hymenolepis microstoma]
MHRIDSVQFAGKFIAPNNELEPLVIEAGGLKDIYAIVNDMAEFIYIKNGTCEISGYKTWKPCHINDELFGERR